MNKVRARLAKQQKQIDKQQPQLLHRHTHANTSTEYRIAARRMVACAPMKINIKMVFMQRTKTYEIQLDTTYNSLSHKNINKIYTNP